MSSAVLFDKPVNLCVGAYRIHMTDFRENASYCLPEKADGFIDHNNLSHSIWDINFSINPDTNFTEPANIPLVRVDSAVKPYRIYRRISGGYLWIRCNYRDEIQQVYEISEDWSSWRLVSYHTDRLGYDSFEELGYLFSYSVLNKMGIIFHGIVMEWNGMGIIVCAHSGIGKTTHTNMWREHENAIILNGDRALCCKEEGEWYTYGAPWCGTSKDHMNRRLKLDAVVVLEQADTNQVVVLSPYMGALELIKLMFAPDWEEKLLTDALNAINDITGSFPVLKLKCRPDLNSVSVLKSELTRIRKQSAILN